MQTDNKPLYKKAVFWQLLIPAAVVLAAVIYLIILLAGATLPARRPTETTGSQSAALPPPEENPYNALDFALGENGYLTCITGESMLGIDISYVQKHIDWQQVRDAGIEFAIIKCAGRGYGEEGRLYFDDYWQANYEGARAAGISVGVYFFSQATSVEEAVEEADFLLAQLNGLPLDMPVVYDWEYIDPLTADGIPRTVGMNARTLTDCTKAFCDTIASAGYAPMIYFNADQSHQKMYLEELTGYPFWLASYTTQLDYPYKIDMWQYTDAGTVPGIEGPVDLNLYLKYE